MFLLDFNVEQVNVCVVYATRIAVGLWPCATSLSTPLLTKASCDSAGYGFEAEYIAVLWIRLGWEWGTFLPVVRESYLGEAIHKCSEQYSVIYNCFPVLLAIFLISSPIFNLYTGFSSMEQEKEKVKVQEKLERYTKESLLQFLDVLDVHVSRTLKKV